MTTQIQRRRGTTTQHGSFTGAVGEITIDTTKDTVVVHDGSTVGGHPLAKENNPTFTGNMGVGTSSPGTQLEIAGSASTLLRLDSSNGSGGVIRIRNSGTDTHYFGSAADFITGGAANQTAIRSNSSILFGISGNEKVRIDSSGRLLLGTTSAPTCTAMFQGRSDGATNSANLRLAKGSSTPGSTDSLGILSFSDSGSQASAQIQVSRDSGTWTSGSRTPGSMLFMTAPDSASGVVERLRIDSSGNVGVGTASADANLHIKGGFPTVHIERDSAVNYSRLL